MLSRSSTSTHEFDSAANKVDMLCSSIDTCNVERNLNLKETIDHSEQALLKTGTVEESSLMWLSGN